MRPVGPACLPLLALAAALLLFVPSGSSADDSPRAPLVDAETQGAIDRGLRFLARTQNPDGSWTSDAGQKVNEQYVVAPGGKNVHHVGVTALGILAFLASGHVPERGPYGKVVSRAVDFLLSRVQHDGFIQADQTRMYSHAFATLALAEVYGMSKDPPLRLQMGHPQGSGHDVRCVEGDVPRRPAGLDDQPVLQPLLLDRRQPCDRDVLNCGQGVDQPLAVRQGRCEIRPGPCTADPLDVVGKVGHTQ